MATSEYRIKITNVSYQHHPISLQVQPRATQTHRVKNTISILVPFTCRQVIVCSLFALFQVFQRYPVTSIAKPMIRQILSTTSTNTIIRVRPIFFFKANIRNRKLLVRCLNTVLYYIQWYKTQVAVFYNQSLVVNLSLHGRLYLYSNNGIESALYFYYFPYYRTMQTLVHVINSVNRC